MAAYARRHYGIGSYRLTRPRVIVEHYTVNDSVQATFNTFAPDVADVELHELPGVCAHFVIGSTAGSSSSSRWPDVPPHRRAELHGDRHRARRALRPGHLGNPRQLRASLALTSWLRCRYEIGVRNVIGHSESLSARITASVSRGCAARRTATGRARACGPTAPSSAPARSPPARAVPAADVLGQRDAVGKLGVSERLRRTQRQRDHAGPDVALHVLVVVDGRTGADLRRRLAEAERQHLRRLELPAVRGAHDRPAPGRDVLAECLQRAQLLVVALDQPRLPRTVTER